MARSSWICEVCGEPNNTDLCTKCGRSRPQTFPEIPQAGSMRSITGWAPWDSLGGRYGLMFLFVLLSPLLFDTGIAAISCIRQNLNP